MTYLVKIVHSFEREIELEAENEKKANDMILESFERLKSDGTEVSETINITFLKAWDNKKEVLNVH